MEALAAKISEAFKNKLEVETDGEYLWFIHPSTNIQITLTQADTDELKTEDDTIEFVKSMTGMSYKTGDCLYDTNYFEGIVKICGSYVDMLCDYGVNIADEDVAEGAFHYEISEASDEFCKFFDGERAFKYLEAEKLTTVKLYNIPIEVSSNEQFVSDCKSMCKNVFFDICRKTSVAFELVELSQDLEDDPFQDVSDKLDMIQKTPVVTGYDKDLLQYYYRGSTMDASEFKFISFYQVLECIFDEVYMHETTQDVKSLLNSNWFDSRSDEHAQNIIGMVEKYNKDKNDRNKLQLVLQKYFRGETHDEAFILANKEIIRVLTELGQIKKNDDLKDLQKLASIIYDFRCTCTHSNRSFPKPAVPHTPQTLYLYIDLIKMVAEVVIVNYRR